MSEKKTVPLKSYLNGDEGRVVGEATVEYDLNGKILNLGVVEMRITDEGLKAQMCLPLEHISIAGIQDPDFIKLKGVYEGPSHWAEGGTFSP